MRVLLYAIDFFIQISDSSKLKKKLTVQPCDLRSCTATVPTPPEAPNISTRKPSFLFINKLPNRNKALQAVIAA